MTCTHIIKHIHASCGCCIDHPSKIMMLVYQSEEHMTEHREYDAGIIHHMSCKHPEFKMIPVPKLVLNKKVLKDIGVEIK